MVCPEFAIPQVDPEHRLVIPEDDPRIKPLIQAALEVRDRFFPEGPFTRLILISPFGSLIMRQDGGGWEQLTREEAAYYEHELAESFRQEHWLPEFEG